MLNKKMLLSLLIIGVVSVSAGAGTWAYFSDAEISEGNTFTAGTLDLLVNNEDLDGITIFNWDNKAPGDSGTQSFMLENDGSRAGDLVVDVTMAYSSGTDADPEQSVSGNTATTGDLGEYLGVKLFNGTDYIVGSVTAYAPLKDLEAVWESQTPAMAQKDTNVDSGTDTVIYTLSWAIADDIVDLDDGTTPVDDNIIQGDGATMAITFTLNQAEAV